MRFKNHSLNYITNKRQISRGKLIVSRAALSLVADYFYPFTTLKASMSQCLWIGLRVTVVQNVGVHTTALADATSAVGAAALITVAKVDQLVAPVLLHQYEQLLLESFSCPVIACGYHS
jgi:hypothetical protein